MYRSEAITPELFDDLYLLQAIYRNPLELKEKIRARSELLIMYDKAASDYERQLLTDIMEYYDLFE